MTAMLDAADPQRTIAELRRQLDECRAELVARNSAYSERIEQQSATIDVLKVMSVSPGDPQPVFDLIVRRARDLCDAYGMTVYEFDGELIHWRAATGVSDDPAARRTLESMYPMTPTREWAAGRAILDCQIIRIDDMETEPGLNRAMRGLTVKSAVLVPLVRGGVPIGALALGSRERGGFSDSQIDLLKTFAEQAVIAITSAETYRELQQRTGDLQEALECQIATAEVLQAINSSPGDLAPVFDAMLEKATRLCDADFGILWSFAGEFATAGALHQVPAAYADMIRAPFRPSPESGPARMMRGDGTFVVPDLLEFPPYHAGDPLVRAIVDLAGARSVVIAPLRNDALTIGAITIYRQEVRPFTERQIDLLENFAAQAVIAMENARLLGELRARTDEVAAWNRELEDRVAAQLGELERVGKLKRFLAPQIAELIVARGDEAVLETHRRDIVVVFCDMRGFTAFAETAEPEEVLDLLREYHAALGPIVSESEGTLDHFSGDGVL